VVLFLVVLFKIGRGEMGYKFPSNLIVYNKRGIVFNVLSGISFVSLILFTVVSVIIMPLFGMK